MEYIEWSKGHKSFFLNVRAGQLESLLKLHGIQEAGSMKLFGEIDGADIRIIRGMKHLRKLDLSNVTIVSGGGPYFAGHITEEDVFGANILSGMYQLRELLLPNSVKVIGQEAVQGCSGLTSITIPKNVTDVHELAFADCTGLKELILEDTKDWLRFGVGPTFRNCPIQHLYMGRVCMCVERADSAFERWYDFDEYSPFRDMDSIEHVNVGRLAEWVPNSAFEGCHGLKSVYLSGKTCLLNSCFCLCTNLSEVFFEDGCVEYQDASFPFCYCDALKSAVFTENVDAIDEELLDQICLDFKEIHLKSSLPVLIKKSQSRSLSDQIRQNVVLYVPEGYINVYEAYPDWKGFKCIIEGNLK